MLVYEHITNLSRNHSELLKEHTKSKGWTQKPMEKNPMQPSRIAGPWEITRDDDTEYHNILLDENLIVYRKFGNEELSEKYNRMTVWENEFESINLHNVSFDELKTEIERNSNDEHDKIYLTNKLLREDVPSSLKSSLSTYLDQF